ncbi:50S ribosomal protein L21, partial [Candidatus Collierbacteria bacterium]|nr:50S ribosomal protein L21 [Candidatus Collierbacteria bacterium]
MTKKDSNPSAVIQLGAKQYLVKVGDKIEAEKVSAKEGENLVIKEVLLVTVGDETTVGSPYVEKASVEL